VILQLHLDHLLAPLPSNVLVTEQSLVQSSTTPLPTPAKTRRDGAAEEILGPQDAATNTSKPHLFS
jgi:hypothetical protein